MTRAIKDGGRTWPFSSVMVFFTFSISTGLAASTVTPGMTAPDVSFTVPVKTLCARAATGSSTSIAANARHVRTATRNFSFPQSEKTMQQANTNAAALGVGETAACAR